MCDDKCTIILDKKEIYAMEDKGVILQGDCNLTDSLWDITIQKHNIDENNYKKPDQHGLLCLQEKRFKYKGKRCIYNEIKD